MERDYDGWGEHGAKGWAFKDVLPMFKAQEDWEGGANEWRGVGVGRSISSAQTTLIRPPGPSSKRPSRWDFPSLTT
jgi:choline dehydrogenase-like flavoprotein